MITHVVLFKFEGRKKESIEMTKQMLLDMQGKISELKYIEVGENIVQSDRAYDLALISKFESISDLDAYQIHPVHQQVSKYIATVKDSIVAVDFES